jgi:hypothetical protein
MRIPIDARKAPFASYSFGLRSNLCLLDRVALRASNLPNIFAWRIHAVLPRVHGCRFGYPRKQNPAPDQAEKAAMTDPADVHEGVTLRDQLPTLA